VPIHSPNSAPPNRSIERSKPRTDARVSHLSEGDSDDRRRAGLRALSRPLKMGTSARVPSIAALLGIVLIWSIASMALAVAHESWISRGGYRNSAGEWLCGVTERETPGQIAVRARRRELWTNLARSVGAARPLRLRKPTAIFPDGSASSYRPPTRPRASGQDRFARSAIRP
jgi:hypothetical protein